MEENKNSLLGIESNFESNDVNAVPYLISLPEKEESAVQENNVSIQTPQATPVFNTKPQQEKPNKTDATNTAPVVPSAPVLLQSNEEYDKTNVVQGIPTAPSLLQSNEEYDKNQKIPYLLERPVDAAQAQPSTEFNFDNIETEEDINITQKFKSAKSMNSIAQKLTKEQQILKDLEEKVAQKNQENSEKEAAARNFLSIKAGFESVQKVLDYQRENSNKPDYDDQHYTVPENQSLFNLTVNQISGIPHWRGR